MNMNMLDLMNKLTQLQAADLTEAKAETTHKGGTKTTDDKGTTHKGRYGNEYQGDSDDEERDSVTGKKKKAPKVMPSDGEKRGRGRPAKAGSEGDGKKYANAAALQSFIVGNKPSKAVEKLPKTKSNKTLKDWIENLDNAINEGEEVTIAPATATNTQVIKQGQNTLGTVSNPQLAQQIKQSIGKGEMTLAGNTLGEDAQGKTARIFFNKDLGEYTVRFYQNGKHMADADYFTDDKEDARSTAKASCEEQGEEEVTERSTSMYNEAKKAKPDFLDVDKDKNKKEPFKKAVKDKAAKTVEEAKKAKPDFLDVDKDGDKKEPFKKAVKDKETKTVEEGFGTSMARAGAKLKGLKANITNNPKDYQAAADAHRGVMKRNADNGPDDNRFSDASARMNDYKKGRAEAGLGRMAEAKKPSAGMTAKEKSAVVTKAKAGKDIGKAGKGFEKVAAKAAKEYGSKEKGQKVAAAAMWKGQAKKVSESKMSNLDADLKDKNFSDADFKKQYGKTKAEMRASMKDKPDAKKKVAESVLNDSTGATLDHICKTFSREVADFKQTGDMDEDLFQALYDYYFDDMPYGVKKARSGDPYEWVSDRFQEDMPLEEGTREDFTTHGMDSQPSKVMPMPAKPAQTPWSRDPIAALTDRAYDKFASKPKTPQFESWNTQLDSLLNEDITEGMTVSISKGQQGSPDSVSINAQDAEADQLLALVKSAGLGLFGGDEAQTPGGMNMSSANGGEAGAVDVEVVDDHDDMLSLIRKMTGQAPAQQASSEDYADEEGTEEHAEEVCGDCGHSECECETEEVVDETETDDQREFEVSEDDNVAQAGAQEAGEDSALASAAGQAQSAEEDEPEEEEAELEESFANSEDDKFQTDIDFMTNVITGGLNRQKRNQSVGNPVTIASTPMKESADLLSDFRKLSGL